jgi:hypothetical protein
VVTKRKPCDKIIYHQLLLVHSTGTHRSKLEVKKKFFFETAANDFINHAQHLPHGEASIYVSAVAARMDRSAHACSYNAPPTRTKFLRVPLLLLVTQRVHYSKQFSWE